MLEQLQRFPWREILFLCLISCLVYGVGAFTPSLFEDEWYHIREMVMNGNRCPWDSFFFRPLTGCYYGLIQALFGINVRAFHLLLLLWRTLIALVFYAFLLKIVPLWRKYAFLTSITFLVFPTVFMWPMFALGHIYLAYLMCFLGCYTLVIFASGHSWCYWILSISLFIVSMLLYEAGIGLIVFVSLLLLSKYRNTSPQRIVGIAIPLVVIVLFSIGRWISQIQVTNAFGHDTEHVLEQMAPEALLTRLSRGYWINLGRSSLDSIYDVFETSYHFPYRQMWPWVIGLGIMITLLISYLIVRNRSSLVLQMRECKSVVGFPIGLPWNTKDLLFLMIAGFLAIGAGYFPSILAVDPGMSYGASRINFLPSAGASVFIVTLMVLITKLITLEYKRFGLTISLLVFFFVVFSGRVHIRSQLETRQSWAIQRTFWNEMFLNIPDLRSDTQLILTLPETYIHPVKYGAPPFAIYWRAFGGGIALLYGDDKPFDVRVVYGQGPEAIQVSDGSLFIPPHFQQLVPQPIPITDTVILVFGEQSGQFEVIQRLEMHQDDLELCQNCIEFDRDEDDIVRWRSLVDW